jgi:hypothetical protein
VNCEYLLSSVIFIYHLYILGTQRELQSEFTAPPVVHNKEIFVKHCMSGIKSFWIVNL